MPELSLPEPTPSSMENRKKRVAIIGAGWNGLQTAKDLLARGVEVTLFEMLDDVGGTWHPSRRTAGLKLHSPLYMCRFDGLQYDDTKTSLHRRLEGEEVQEYNGRFADFHGLRERTRFLRKVVALDYIALTTQVSVTHVDSRCKSPGAESPSAGAFDSTTTAETQIFDFACFTSQCGVMRMPRGADEASAAAAGFKGKSIHSAYFQEDFIQEILQTPGARVAVVGASKSAVDVLTALDLAVKKQTTASFSMQDQVAWVYGKMYWFLPYERVVGNRKKTFSQKFDGAWFLICFLLAQFIGGSWVLWLLKCRGLATLPEADKQHRHYDGSKCHIGCLDAAHLAVCASLSSETNRIRDASFKGFYPDGILLEDGREVPCTHAVFATGYESGLKDVRLSVTGPIDPTTRSPSASTTTSKNKKKDNNKKPTPASSSASGTPTSKSTTTEVIQAKTERAESYFFLEHLPTVATGILAQFSFGPMRATAFADLILRRLNHGVPPLAERQALIDKQRFKGNLETNIGFYSRRTAEADAAATHENKSGGGDDGRVGGGRRGAPPPPPPRGTDIFSQIIFLNYDWMDQGIISFRAFLVHWWGIFVNQVQTPIVTKLMSE